MMIKVLYPDKRTDYINSDSLDFLIKKKEIVAFYRSGGWVRLDQGPTRNRKEPFAGKRQRAADLGADTLSH